MPAVPFDQLPDDARVWIFAASRPLHDGEQERLLEVTDRFLEQWNAHGSPLTAARDLRYERFLLIAVDERAAGVSGCSIDAMTHGLRDLEQDLGTTLIDHSAVLYRAGGEIERVSRADFSVLADQGVVTPETTVFNNTVPTVGDVRTGRWEVPASESWHAGAFF